MSSVLCLPPLLLQPPAEATIQPHWSDLVSRMARFQTELGYDFLEIHDGPNLLSPLVGSFNGTQVPQFLFSSNNFLYLLFTTTTADQMLASR
ncbi:hypothetical protein F7725_025154 [Dissostichus mawsoni]|uniref:CUB domain-containing protein n=1 Tax=Dissostichus mawsoni TaxID=36200 RepID=A0A7J5XAC0_DISMA|nr:hypothetical protein F7725_025154 [Dissostichus mawsoni]